MNIACGDCLIGIEQVGGRAGRAEAAGAARIDAVDVIEAIAGAELIVSLKLWSILAKKFSVCTGLGKSPVEISGPGKPAAVSRALMVATAVGAMVARPDWFRSRASKLAK